MHTEVKKSYYNTASSGNSVLKSSVYKRCLLKNKEAYTEFSMTLHSPKKAATSDAIKLQKNLISISETTLKRVVWPN